MNRFRLALALILFIVQPLAAQMAGNRSIEMAAQFGLLPPDLVATTGFGDIARFTPSGALGPNVKLVNTVGLLRSALSAARSGQVIMVLPGTYVCDSLTVPAGVSLVGLDPKTTILQGSTTLKDTNSGLLELGGGNTISGLDVSRTDTVNVGTPGPLFRLMAAGSFYITNNRIGNTPDVINTSGANLYDLRFTNNYIYTVWWDQITLSQYANGSKFYIADNRIGGDCSCGTCKFFYNTVSANWCYVWLLRNYMHITLTSNTTTDVVITQALATATASSKYWIKGNRWYVDGSAYNQNITRLNITKAITKYIPTIIVEDDTTQFTSSGTVYDVTINTNASAVSGTGGVTAINSDLTRINGNYNIANYPPLQFRGSTLKQAYSVTDAASIAIDPNRAEVHKWTPTQAATLTINSTGGSYYTGQEVELQLTADSTTSRVMTFSTGFKSTGTLGTGTTAGKKVGIRFRYDGTDWVECWRQSTGV